jgi:signal transduction histidine kinase
MDARSSSQTELSQRELVARAAAAFGALFRDMQRTLAADVGACEHEALAAWAVRGGRLADDLLAYAGAQPLAPGPLDPRLLLRTLAGDLRRALDPTFEVVVRIADDCPECVADGDALTSALLALVANARDAMPDGGIVALLAGPARLGDGSLAVELTVRDEGAGLAPDVRAIATQPFVTTKAGRTSGLGLAVADGFARQSGGELSLTSSSTGTACRLVLPGQAAARERS